MIADIADFFRIVIVGPDLEFLHVSAPDGLAEIEVKVDPLVFRRLCHFGI